MKLTVIDGGRRSSVKESRGLLNIISTNVTAEGGRLTEAAFFKSMAAMYGRKHLRAVK